jgi:Protein of unknown function (DUF3558)
MTIHTRSAAGLLLLSAVLAACSGASTVPATSGPGASAAALPTTGDAQPSDAAPSAVAPAGAAVDACAIITEKEATAFLGSDPGAGMSTGTAAAPACAYGGSLTFVVELGDGKSLYDSTKAAMQGSGKAQDLTGVGDQAFAFIVANTIAQMVIVKGTTMLTVNVQGDPSLQNITVEALTALGTTAAGRI